MEYQSPDIKNINSNSIYTTYSKINMLNVIHTFLNKYVYTRPFPNICFFFHLPLFLSICPLKISDLHRLPLTFYTLLTARRILNYAWYILTKVQTYIYYIVLHNLYFSQIVHVIKTLWKRLSDTLILQ